MGWGRGSMALTVNGVIISILTAKFPIIGSVKPIIAKHLQLTVECDNDG